MQLINKCFVFAKIVFYVTAKHGYTTKALLRFRPVKHYRDSIHHHDICWVTIVRVKIVLLLNTNYCCTLTMHNPQFKELPDLDGLHLALPITTEDCFEITLLIGADHYWDVVEDRIIRGNGPTTMKSKVNHTPYNSCGKQTRHLCQPNTWHVFVDYVKWYRNWSNPISVYNLQWNTGWPGTAWIYWEGSTTSQHRQLPLYSLSRHKEKLTHNSPTNRIWL